MLKYTSVRQKHLKVPLEGLILTIKIGALERLAIKATPAFADDTRPLMMRVPSGKIPRTSPFFTIDIQVRIALRSLPSRSTGKAPIFLRIQPKIGALHASFFAIK